jgi:polar amino acid transport system substrate-binding protein
MLTRRRLLAAACGLTLAAAACGVPSGNLLERARRAGTLRIGISGERPYGYTDSDGRITGAQPEVARAVLARLGIGGIDAVQMQFDQLLDGLLHGTFDLVAAAMTITPQRCAKVAFSRPDFVAPPAFLVPVGNPRKIATFGDVARARVRLGVLGGSTEIDYAKAAGVRPEQLEVFSGQSTLFRGVAQRSVEVGALTAISLADELRRNPGSGLQVTAPTVPIIDGRRVVPAAGFAMRKEDNELRAAFDRELTALQDSGEWLNITRPFGLTAKNLPDRKLTTEGLCYGPS